MTTGRIEMAAAEAGPFPAFRRVFRAGMIMLLIQALALPVLPAQAAQHGHHGKKTAKIAGAKASPRYAAIVMDAATGAVLHEDQADKTVYPASLTKMMTLLLVFQALRDGRATLRDQVHVSRFASTMAPSKLDLDAGSSIKLEDAIYAVVTKSANDVAVALGEHIGGTQGTFVSMMNRKASELGMRHTYFANACGLHDKRQVTTARDMAILARALIYQYPGYYHYFATQAFTYDRRTYPNHNHLMETYKGMDGIKTGYIGPSGFNLVASAKRGDRRLIGVVFGGQSAKSRDARMASLLDSAFARYGEVQIAGAAMPVPGRKPADRADAALAESPAAARWANLGSVLQDRAVNRVVGTPLPADSGEGDSDPEDAAAPPPAVQAAQQSPALPEAVMRAAYAESADRNWAVQVGAWSSRVRTDQALQAFRNGLPADLQHGIPLIAPLQTAQGWVFRGRIQGLSKAEAERACSHAPECMTVAPDGQ